MLGRVTVTRIRATVVVDRYGDDQPGTPTETDIRGCHVAPRSSSDLTAPGRQGVLIGYTLYAPHGTDIATTDQIRYAGDVYDIDGEPGAWLRAGSQRPAGVEVALRRAAG